MKAFILCGGLGMRLREHTETRPKPMVEVGGRPILWHVMKTYAHYGITDFVLCLGYKGDQIKEYFLHYEARNCDFTVTHGASSGVEVHDGRHAEDGWRVTLVDTGNGDDEIRAADEALEMGWLRMGARVREFEAGIQRAGGGAPCGGWP